MKEELKKYLDKYLNQKEKKHVFFESEMADFECAIQAKCAMPDLDNYLINNEDKNKFQKLLFEYIDTRNLKDSDVYNKVHIDRRLFSKIRSDDNYHPSKETVLLLGLSLELNEDEIEKLLGSASYSLPKNNRFDLIMRFCFKNKIYSLE